MKCQRCNELSRVLETRDGVFRRRECPNGHRFYTHEVWVKDIPKRNYEALQAEVVRLVKENVKPKRIAAILGVATSTAYRRIRKGVAE